MLKRILLQIWRVLPLWLQIVLSRVIRPLFQVFAAAVILDEEKNILLVKSTYNRFHPWGLPGGSLEYGEHPEDAVIREVHEETGLTICIEKLLLIKSWTPDRVGMFYLCKRIQPIRVCEINDHACDHRTHGREHIPHQMDKRRTQVEVLVAAAMDK